MGKISNGTFFHQTKSQILPQKSVELSGTDYISDCWLSARKKFKGGGGGGKDNRPLFLNNSLLFLSFFLLFFENFRGANAF